MALLVNVLELPPGVEAADRVSGLPHAVLVDRPYRLREHDDLPQKQEDGVQDREDEIRHAHERDSEAV